MLIASTVEICIQQLDRVEEIVWLPYDAGLSAAADTLVGIIKRVIVTPTVYLRFLEFLRVDIQCTGHILSRPWSRHPNDIMSDIECTQLQSELFRRRHSTRQSHGLFALAKHLFVTYVLPFIEVWIPFADFLEWSLRRGRIQKLRRVDKNSSPILSRLLTKAHQIFKRFRRPLVVSSALTRLSTSCFFWRYSPVSVEVAKEKRTNVRRIVGRRIFSGGTTRPELFYDRLLAQFTSYRLSKFSWV